MIKSLPYQTFDSANSTHEIDEFIKWSDLLENHVEKDEATFEIELMTKPLKQTQIGLKEVTANFHIKIENVSKLTEIYSPEVILQGVRWKISCDKDDDSLWVFVCGKNADMDEHWSYGFNATINLLSHDGDGVIKHFSDKLHLDCSSWGIPIVKWAELIGPENYYVVEDKAILTVTVKADKPVPMW